MQIRRHGLPALVTFWFLINILILFHMNKVWGRDWFHSVHLHMSVFRIHAFCLENRVCLFNVFQILWKCCTVWKSVQLVFLDLFYCEKVRVICSYLLWISPPPPTTFGGLLVSTFLNHVNHPSAVGTIDLFHLQYVEIYSRWWPKSYSVLLIDLDINLFL